MKNPLDYVLKEKPTGTRRFDPNMDQGMIQAYAVTLEDIFVTSQMAVIPPGMLLPEGYVKFTAALLQIRNLTEGTSAFHVSIRVDYGGIHTIYNHRKIVGVTTDDELLFELRQGVFMTVTHERRIRERITEFMSKELKDSGHGGDITKFFKDAIEKEGLGGMFGSGGDDPDDWWKRGDEPPPPKS